MVGNKDQTLECRNMTSFDAYLDMRRCRASWPTQLDLDNILCEQRKILEKDGEIEKGYKNFLFCLLSTDTEMSVSQTDEEDDEMADPETKLFLQHLRPRGEHSVLEYEKEGMLVVSPYGEMCSDDECECNLESEGTAAEHVMIGGVIGQKRGRGRPRKLKNACQNIPRSSSVNNKRRRKTINNDPTVVNATAGGVIGQKRGRGRPRKLKNACQNIPRSSPVNNERRRKTRNNDPTAVNATVGDLTVPRRFTRSMTSNGENRQKNIPGSKKTDTRRKSRNETGSGEAEVVRVSLDEYLHLLQNVNLQDGDHHVKNDKVKRDDVGPTSFKNGSSSMRKSRNVLPKNVEIVKCSYRDFMIAKKSRDKEQKREKLRKLSGASEQTPRVGNQPKRGRGRPRKTCQAGTSSAVRKSRNVTDEIEIEKGSSNESTNAKAPNKEINIKKEVEDESIPEDLPACFVPSKRFRRDIVGNNSKQRGGSSASNEFRKQVLSVLGKPFDKDEYTRHTRAVKDGNYLVYYPDLKKKLNKYHYKRAKRMTVFRGFFFWLQNVTQEGAFKPWKDRECLDVVPGSHVKPSTRN